MGFYDTLIFCPEVVYEQYNYQGPAPLFVQIWFPLAQPVEGPWLSYGDFRKTSVTNELLLHIHDELWQISDPAFIDYNLTYTIPEEEEINYQPGAVTQFLAHIKTHPTRSKKASFIQPSNYPVIVYHHGAGGVPDENYIMAEYFASRGYIFVSANFHHPYKNASLGQAPFLAETGYQNDQHYTQTLLQFSRSLTTHTHLFYVGHSWGAQAGWGLLHQKNLADAFVSMETTLEDKTDTALIKEYWPQLYHLIREQKVSYPLPVLLFAGTQTNQPFSFFDQTPMTKKIEVTPKTFFAHDSYTAAFMLRYFYKNKYKQPDLKLLKNQLLLYMQHLRIMECFFQSVLNSTTARLDAFNSVFYIRQ